MGLRLDVVSACEMGLIDMILDIHLLFLIFVTNQPLLRQTAFAQ